MTITLSNQQKNYRNEKINNRWENKYFLKFRLEQRTLRAMCLKPTTDQSVFSQGIYIAVFVFGILANQNLPFFLVLWVQIETIVFDQSATGGRSSPSTSRQVSVASQTVTKPLRFVRSSVVRRLSKLPTGKRWRFSVLCWLFCDGLRKTFAYGY